MEKIHLLLYLSAFIFCIGLAIILIKRNAIVMLMGIELMLNAANLNLVVFNQSQPTLFHGHIFALFVILIAVCETAVGLAVVLSIYRYYNTSIPNEINELRG